MSFGTGQHPTTEYCLRELVRRRKAGMEEVFLDVGTGSGILAFRLHVWLRTNRRIRF